MRKIVLFLLTFVCLATTCMAHPEIDYRKLMQTKNMNSLCVWLSGGYNSINDQNNLTLTQGKSGFELGVGYEWYFFADKNKNNGFVMQAGLSGALLNSQMTCDPFGDSQLMKDTEGDIFTMNFAFNNIREQNQFINLNLSLLAGYTYKNWYFLVGPKFTFNTICTTKTFSDVTTTARYDGLIGDDGKGLFGDMPNHFLYTKNRELKTQYLPNIGIGGSFEVGYIFLLGKKKKSQSELTLLHALKVGLFAEYRSIMNTANTQKMDKIAILNTGGEYQPTANSFLYNEQKNLTNLFCGIKLTYTLNYQQCYTCWRQKN